MRLLHRLDRPLRASAGRSARGSCTGMDKDTSGLLLVAKNDFAHGELSRQLAAREMEKHYRALVEGVMKEDAGEVALPLGRSKTDRKKMAVDPQGRDALTRWRAPARGRAATLLDVRILTGRTHQIRVHMQAIHHPVAGDPLYGTRHGVPVAADAPRLFPGLYASAHGKAYGVYRPLAGGLQPGVALRRASRDR